MGRWGPMEVDPVNIKGNPQALPTVPTMSPPAIFCPCSRPCFQSVGWQPIRRHLLPIVVSALASQVVVRGLAAPMLAKPVSQQSVAGAAWYLMRQAGAGAATVYGAVCHHDPDRLHPGQFATGAVAPRPHPVSTVPTPPH